MKKTTKTNLFLAVIILLMIWVPYTRVFLVGNAFMDIVTILLSLLLIISSIYIQVKQKSWLNIVTLVIGLSPLIFSVLVLVLYKIYPMP